MDFDAVSRIRLPHPPFPVPSTFSMTADNGSAIDTLARELVTSVLPEQGDVLYALERVKATILERTARGVDVDGAPFAPYSSKGPYYAS